MTGERWREVTEIFRAAVERDAGTREAFLDQACQDDPSLRGEVEALVTAHFEAGSFGAAPLAVNVGEVKRIAPGTRLGPFRIDAPIGAGGMGEVYRAHDTMLGRDVAIKVLPNSVAADPDRLARFDREARLLAALNHPHIAAIYGFEDADGIPALVLELVEGPTLAERLARGQMPVAEVLKTARQIAEALDAAHERGIVHRDLKPANIKLTADGRVKVLDFGLAKAISGESGSGSSPTLAATHSGMLLGTAAYMSPEQARGQNVDRRTDIWAFGCVLYEMLAGRQSFAEATIPDTIAAVLEREPDWTALPAAVPPAIRRLLRHCLEKHVKRRLRDIADTQFELAEEALETASTSEAGRHLQLWVTMALCCATSLGLGWLVGTRLTSAPVDVSRLMLDVRPATSLLGSSPVELAPFGQSRPSRTALALSPDGRTLAFTAQRERVTRLYIRTFDQLQGTEVAGTEGADSPIFSPDGKWVGFWADGAIRKVALAGGPAVRLCDVGLPFGSSWSSDGLIVFASGDTTIWKVASSGGAPEQITTHGGEEARHLLPYVLPGNKWLLLTVLPTVNDWEHTQVVVQSLKTGERKVLLEGAADARYIPTGHLVFMRQGKLMVAPFDADRAALTGSEAGLIEGVMQSINANSVPLDTGAGQFTFSSTGTLVYVDGELSPDLQGKLEWIDRDGSIERIPAPLRPYALPRLSPDGRHVAVITAGMRDHDLWRYDFAEGTLTRLTTEGRANWPAWSPDGTDIVFGLALKGPYNLFSVRADGGAAPQRLGESSVTQFGAAWTPDGRSLVFPENPTNIDLKILTLGGRPAVQPLIASRFNETMPELSPDGRWLAYVSDESGRDEVYVQAFPGLGKKRQISTSGGIDPAWSRNGRKLTFLSPAERRRDGFMQLMEVDVTLGASFAATSPHSLFEPSFAGDVVRPYDLTADAGRFIFIRETYPPVTSAPREMHIVQHWFEELKQRVPAR